MGITAFECPHCETPYNRGEGDTCPNCGGSRSKPGLPVDNDPSFDRRDVAPSLLEKMPVQHTKIMSDKKAYALTNEGYGTNSKCYKCQQTIGEGELSTWEGGMECHAGRCPAPAAPLTPGQRSQRIQNMPQRGAPKSEQELGLQRREQSGYAPMASEK